VRIGADLLSVWILLQRLVEIPLKRRLLYVVEVDGFTLDDFALDRIVGVHARAVFEIHFIVVVGRTSRVVEAVATRKRTLVAHVVADLFPFVSWTDARIGVLLHLTRLALDVFLVSALEIVVFELPFLVEEILGPFLGGFLVCCLGLLLCQMLFLWL